MEHPPHRPAAAGRRSAGHLARRLAGAVARSAPVLLAALLALAPVFERPAAAAEPLPPPTGEVLLVITGDISLPNVGDEAHLDRAHLASLPRARYTTETPWSERDAQAFEGVRLDALLAAVGARSTRFRAIASDDYAALFEGVDLERYPVIVADTRDGAPLTMRTLGPLRIMFPFSDHPELLTDSNVALGVWQLVAMDVR